MFLLRQVELSDLDAVLRLAKVLNTLNLPNNRESLVQIITQSVRSFSKEIVDIFDREYFFVLEDTEKNLIIGTSMIWARHGTKESPHSFLRVHDEEHYSKSIDRYFKHQTLKVGYDYNGPTEIGALVLDPEYRGHALKLGKQLSFIRFMFIGMYQSLFRKRILAELLPPLPKGRSALWEALGKKFTGLEYQEADYLSKNNKEFIRHLFPQGMIYCNLLAQDAQEVIGQVGPNTKGVQRMLEKLGFQYVNRVDPFDGGPHYEAEISKLWPVKNQYQKQLKFLHKDFDEQSQLFVKKSGFIAKQSEGEPNDFRAIYTTYFEDELNVYISYQYQEQKVLSENSVVSCLEF